MDDVFCKIIKGEIPAEVIHKDEDFWVIKDINPQAPVHLLIFPVKHSNSLEDFIEENSASLVGKALVVAHGAAHEIGVAEEGYRLIINEGDFGGRLVPHLHIHLLGGKKLGPKMVR